MESCSGKWPANTSRPRENWSESDSTQRGELPALMNSNPLGPWKYRHGQFISAPAGWWSPEACPLCQDPWDALLVSACVEAGVTRLYTEDMSDGERFESVEIINPFARR